MYYYITNVKMQLKRMYGSKCWLFIQSYLAACQLKVK